jgi:hypothetical protein
MSDGLNELARRFDGFEERQRKDHDIITRMDERTKSEAEQADYRHKNLTTAISDLASKDDHSALAKRVSDIEDTHKWLFRTAIAAYGAFTGAMYAMGKKLGLVP